MADYTRYGASRIKTWTSTVFEKLGAPAKDAAMTAEALVHADLMGIDSHGLNRLPGPTYAGGLQAGRIDPTTTPEVVHQAASTAVVDGNGGLGPVAATVAMDLAFEKAKQTGRASCHSGTATTTVPRPAMP